MDIKIYDTTLRDGEQGENISFSVMDKINITKALDKLGVSFIEAGNPYSNPKDKEFFNLLNKADLENAKIVAFGSTRRKNTQCCNDDNLNTLKACRADYVTIFGKSSVLHVTDVINTTLEENLNMISESIEYLKQGRKHVFFDAEHFFDGYKLNSEYALLTLKRAVKAGAEYITLCDTNGGSFPDEIFEIVRKVKTEIQIPLGIHCHNDTGCAVANSISASKSGATLIQGTFIGIGERCGNANLSCIIPNLQIKLGYNCIPDDKLSSLQGTAKYICEITNIALPDNMPYIGKSAFSHKGGMHIDGVLKNHQSFEHISPSLVGNTRQYILSEVSGRNAVYNKVKQFIPDMAKDSPELSDIMEMLKIQEMKGYHYEAAFASFELLVLKFLGKFKSFFDIDYFKIIGEQAGNLQKAASAMVKIRVGNQTQIAADEGDGPVNALDKAMRSALSKFYPDSINVIELIDYKVRVMDTGEGTAAMVRVLIESSDGNITWTTVGASTDIINASVKALVDSIEYKLLIENKAK